MYSRRCFLETLAATTLSLLLGSAPRALPRGSPVLRLGAVVPDSAEFLSTIRGMELGVAEVERVASLLGREVRLTRAADPEALLDRDGAQLLIGGFDTPGCASLASLAERRGVLFLNIGCADDAFRGPRCSRRMFHIEASDAMRRDAAALAGGAGTPLLWHSSLERFGAAQLNDRFRARYDAPMDSRSWAGWMAVKIAWEAAARLASPTPDAMLEQLTAERTRFDGHKGRPLSFRAWDNQLRQPLYVRPAADGEIVEVPPLVRGGSPPAAEQLDRLGTPADGSTCRWSTAP